MKSRRPNPDLFLGRHLPQHDNYTILRLLDSGQNASVFVAHSTQMARDVACKIIPVENLRGRDKHPPAWRTEITAANQVPSARVVKIFDIGEWATSEGDFIYLLSDLVRGNSLRTYLRINNIDVGFIVSLIENMLDFFRELQTTRHPHGDLHSGNILVEDRADALIGPPYDFRITDFGVAPTATSGRLLDDYEQLGALLRQMLERIDYQALLPQDRSLFEFLRNDLLAKKLLEHDRSYDSDARNPRALFDALAEARRTSRNTETVIRRRLSTPFDYLSCEQIGESHLLLQELYSEKMLGLPAIEEVNNLVLTGPRGCGKTTVFRCLSLKHRVRTEDDAPDKVRYVGIYYRCDDLYYNFSRYQLPSRMEAVDVPLHFLTVTLLRELLESLSSWLPRHWEDSWNRHEALAAKDLWKILGIRKPEHPGAHTFSALIRALEKERTRSAQKQRFVEDANQRFGHYFGPNILLSACDLLSSHFPELRERPVFFFVDDYSSPKISKDLQRSLNRLTMNRSSSCFFKLATESPASYERSDIDGKSYVEGREFRLVNLGMEFINAGPDEKLRFVDDIFNRRFSYAESFTIPDLQSLLGEGPLPEYNLTARQLRDGNRPVVWGRRALGELCSGDVHFLIDLVGKMVSTLGGPSGLSPSDEGPVIPQHLQNDAIRKEAGNFLKNLRSLPKGPALVEIVEAFGNVAASYIRHRNAKNERSNPPHQASRIEPYEDPNLTGEAKERYDDLLRYSVFIEDVRGKSRRGLVVPRLYLRRFLIPFFNLTFSKRDSLELRTVELNELLLEPKKFESRKRLRGPDSNPSDLPGDSQQPLPGLGEGK